LLFFFFHHEDKKNIDFIFCFVSLQLLKSRSNLIDQSKPDLLKGSDPNRSLGSINELSDFTQTARYNVS
jgi:hypothetical protein